MTKLIKQIVGYISALAVILGISLVVFYSPSQDVNLGVDKTSNHLKLKASKEKILSYKVLKEYKLVKKENNLLGATATSTTTSTDIIYDYVEVVENPSSVVEYTYVSDVISTSSVYFEKNETLSNSEYLSPREDNIKPLAFYSEDKWAEDNGQIVDILTATTTLEEFNKIYKISRVDNFRNFFINTSIAATSTYTSSDTWTPSCAGNAQVLVIAGGAGGAGGGSAGGGGAGRVVYDSAHAVTVQAYSVVVGNGGTAGGVQLYGGNGNDSTFDTKTAKGGGGGAGSASSAIGASGGSGGGSTAGSVGGSAVDTNGGGGTSVGYNGGAGGTGSPYTAGGGGGAGAVGENGAGSLSGKGGNGVANSITGSSVIYAGGGGGGGTTQGATAGAGGSGGGGNGSISIGANATGYGSGGGGGGNGPNGAGGTGSKGIVILADPVVCVSASSISSLLILE